MTNKDRDLPIWIVRPPNKLDEECEIPQTAYSPAEAIAALVKRNAVPFNSKKLFGPVCVNELYAIANDQDMLEVDSMVYRGELTLPEAQEYTLVLPEYDILRRKIDHLAKKLVAELVARGSLRAAVQKSVPTAFFRRPSAKLFQPGRAVNELFSEMTEFVTSQNVAGNNYRNTRINSLLNRAIEYFSEALTQELAKREYDDNDREVIKTHFFHHWDKRALSEMSERFPGRILTDVRAHLQQTVQRYKTNFDSLVRAHEVQVGALSDNQLQISNEKMFGEIAQLAQIQKIERKRVKLGECTVDVEAGKLLRSRSFKEQSICIVRLNLDISKKHFRPQIRYAGGDAEEIVPQHQLSEASVELYLDRSTGELCYILTHIPASDSFSKHDYLMLKHAVYSVLNEYLEEKVTAPAKEPIQTVRDVVTDSVALSTPEAHIPRRPQFQDVTVEAEGKHPEEETDARREWKKYLRLLRGTSGNRIFHALRHLLGPPVRQNGSHIFFSGRNRKPHVIALHGAKPIGIAMLEISLEAWEITPKEVYERLI